MKKLLSLIKATMTNDMKIFKIKQKKDNKKNKSLLPIFISFFFMFSIWSYANMTFEKLAPLNMQTVALALVVFLASFTTIMEGIYKTGPLLFNCHDDQLLLSLPIKKQTILFIRIFKFYIFELMFNSLLVIPIALAYIRWAPTIDWTYFLTSFVMLIMLPIIPIVISCIIGTITSNISSKFKYKNLMQIVISMLFILAVLAASTNIDKLFNYLIKHATSINDLITKIYYPAGVYAKLATSFNLFELLLFIFINIIILVVAILILSKFYFKINSNLKIVTTNKTKIGELTIKSNSITKSLIKKEINTFFKIPVFIINAGFALVLYIVTSIGLAIKFDSAMKVIDTYIPMNNIKSNMSIIILILIIVTGFMTSITNSVISLEGRNINILKTLPIKVKTILMAKIYSSLLITTPVLLIGNILLIIKFKISIIESILLLILSILIPLVSHFIGIIVNLKYPKLDAENPTEVVKQSTSSFLAVTIGMLLLVINIAIVTKVFDIINPIMLLLIFVGLYLVVDLILYIILINKGVKQFNALAI